MILTAILLLTIITAVVLAIALLGVGGGVFLVLFADVILCVMFIVWMIKRRIKKKRRK